MYLVSTWAGGPESVFRFTVEGWERREEWTSTHIVPVTSSKGVVRLSKHL
jgi:hypothetical protein